MYFEFSCHGCEKRAAGCHATCDTYKEEKARYDAQKAEIDKKKAINDGIYRQRSKAVAKVTKRKVYGYGKE